MRHQGSIHRNTIERYMLQSLRRSGRAGLTPLQISLLCSVTAPATFLSSIRRQGIPIYKRWSGHCYVYRLQPGKGWSECGRSK
jgi:hypothetical protein